MKSWIDVAADIRSGRFVQILPEWHSPPMLICAVLPSRTLIPSRVRVFIDAVTERLREFGQAAGDNPIAIA